MLNNKIHLETVPEPEKMEHSATPPGLQLLPNFISKEEENELINSIDWDENGTQTTAKIKTHSLSRFILQKPTYRNWSTEKRSILGTDSSTATTKSTRTIRSNPFPWNMIFYSRNWRIWAVLPTITTNWPSIVTFLVKVSDARTQNFIQTDIDVWIWFQEFLLMSTLIASSKTR